MDLLKGIIEIGLGGGAAGVTIAVTWWVLTKFFGSYWTEKGKNLATKDDIGDITGRIEAARLEYARLLEDTKAQLSFVAVQRDRAGDVAELLAEWLSKPKDRKRLNELCIRVNLWLPGQEAKLLNDLLAWKANVDARDVIVAIRRFIQQDHKGDFSAADVTLFRMNADEPLSATTLEAAIATSAPRRP